MAKLTPPLPRPLRPKPKGPSENGDGPATSKEKLAGLGVTAVDWVDERTSMSAGARWLMFRKIPKGTNWFYTLGSATLFAFLSQAVTGVFLAMYYDPSATRAYESTRHLTNDVFLGEFVRGMHKWGSTVMVILVFLHMGRTFFFGAYKYPRELNWVIGVVHRLPAAVRPALVLGDDRRRRDQRHRPAHRPVPQRLLARRARVRRHDAVALLLAAHARAARADRRDDRRAPVPRRAPGHDRPAVDEGRRRPRAP
jgi:hypothetical protein